jgi:hypothetical protein
LGHATASTVAQFTQNLRSGLLSVPQFEQIAVATLLDPSEGSAAAPARVR